ncbi:methyl-accepting chemotaxis protein [Aromatoleum buckelii]|uniref:HAMP domain-containing protein n=1 Tax=Aromatoleum buckelii TaxID=200254 RepID=A0ABX1N621_9RHOO|nr:methyl-accepting chemotaxis protein [Aromatoleum buckelii]MCK0509625.1 methyl-accepting chemotaxis protein [Aromatoleum buckelii]
MLFLDRTSLRGLLAALVALAVGLLVVAGGAYLAEQHERWKSASETRDFVNVMLLASRYVHEIQRERGQSAGYLASASSTGDALQQQRASTDAAVSAFDEAARAWRGFGREELSKIVASLAELRGLRTRVDARSGPVGEATAAYTFIISTGVNALSAASFKLAAASADERLIGIIFSYVDLEWAKEFHGRERAQTNVIVGAEAMSIPQRDLLMGTRALGRNALDLVRARTPDVAVEVDRATAASSQVVMLSRDAVAREEFAAVPPTQWWGQITEYIDGLWSVMEAQAEQIRISATEDAVAARNRLVRALALGLTGIFLFGWLAWSVASRLNRALGEMRRVITDVEGSGDFSKRMTYSSDDEVGQAAKAFNSLLAQFGAIVREVQQSGEGIADAARATAASGIQVTKGSSTQSEAAASVAAAVEETSVSISETSRNATVADEVVERARSGIDQAMVTMRETVANVESVACLIRNARDDVNQLDEDSKKIGGIVQVIKEIADQTNLLALNAAIEAARAGEQGRGFAVVADEVRKLAERTSQATGEIAKLIGGIQNQVRHTVSGMRDANAQTDQSLELVERTATTLRAAEGESASAAINVRSIADAVREQDAAVHQVANSIEKIAQMTEENSVAAEAAAETAARLDALSGKLLDQVARYRT